jgi:hypothetical protein
MFIYISLIFKYRAISGSDLITTPATAASRSDTNRRRIMGKPPS